MAMKHKPAEPEQKAGKRGGPPVHPGLVVRGAIEAIRPPVSVNQVAMAIGWSRAGLGLLCNAERGITPESALRLSAYLGNGDKGAELFMAMQAEYDLFHERKRLKAALARIKPVPRQGLSLERD